jgi:hypothetical protein
MLPHPAKLQQNRCLTRSSPRTIFSRGCQQTSYQYFRSGISPDNQVQYQEKWLL